VIGVVIGVVGVQYIRHRNSNNSEIVFVSEKQALQDDLEKLKKNAPPATASEQVKVTYLDKLRKALAESGDYKGAAVAFDRRISIKVDDLTYKDYVQGAAYYHRLNDKNTALSLLDKAELLLPRDNRPNELYYYEDAKAFIAGIREEYSK